MATVRVEEYLEVIYNLTMEDEPVIAARLAGKFDVSAPTVSEMLKRLQRDGLVEVLPSRHVVLTAKGRELAEDTLRRHRLSERFLAQTLGMDWCQAHEEAHVFQRGLSPALEERMMAVLGDPETCPHGNPIPRAGRDPLQYLRERNAVRLSTVPENTLAEVICISEVVEDESELLRYLGDRAIKPGRTLMPIERAPGTGTLSVRVGEAEPVMIDPRVAEKIWVRRLNSAS
jgi:DtxR family transcriptional regulator, Mn-dependent transcriptional regulator